MKKFKFRLEKVLQHRELVKEEKRRDLMLKNQELQDAQNKLQYLISAGRSNELAQGRIFQAGFVHHSGLFSERIKLEIAQQRIVIAEAQAAVDQAMAEYIEASKDAKTLEMLRERKLQEYNDYLHKEEEKFLDELSVQRGNRTFSDPDNA